MTDLPGVVRVVLRRRSVAGGARILDDQTRLYQLLQRREERKAVRYTFCQTQPKITEVETSETNETNRDYYRE